MLKVTEIPPAEEVLFSDRTNPDDHNSQDTLGYTRGAPIANLCTLCTIISSDPHEYISEWDLAEQAERLGLPEFYGANRAKKPRVMPTRVRHHWYSLLQLELVAKTVKRNCRFFTLSHLGQEVADLCARSGFSFPFPELPAPLREKVATILVDNGYTRQYWLSFFMEADAFSIRDLRLHSTPIFLEIISRKQRVHWGDNGPDLDSGVHIYTPHRSALRSLTVGGRRGNLAREPRFLELTTVAKYEIYDGLRKWTREVELTDEIPLDEARQGFEESPWNDSKISECYVVRQEWPVTRESMKRFEQMVEDAIRSSPSGFRIRIPRLIEDICRKERLSKRNVKDLLLQLHKDNSSRFYFEGASPGVIAGLKQKETQEFYLPIDGIWRTSIALIPG